MGATNFFGVIPMVRRSKQEERRSKSPKRRRAPTPKTGSLKDNLPHGFKMHENGLEASFGAFIPKIQ